MVFRVVHSGTGMIGRAALDGILNHPELELAGMYVQSPDKIGKDVGVFINRAPVGITATNSWDELLALEPDCLCYTSNSIGRELEAANDVYRFLEKGVNAVTASIFAWAYPRAVPAEFAQVHAACEKGQSSAYFSGSDPGWATTDVALTALQMADEVECVRVLELGYWGNYQAEFVCREYFGFGHPPGFQPLLITGGFLKQMWMPTLLTLCHAMDVKIEGWNVVYETDCLDHDVQTGFGVVGAGTASALHFELQALNGGRPVAVVEHVDRVGRKAGLQWKSPYGPGEFAFRIEVEGSPSYWIEHQNTHDLKVEMNMGEMGNVTHGKSTAMPIVNAIPAVCRANPGLLAPRDMAHCVTRNVRRRK
jgi:2,4-diaminopentanoate dehydrogenase